MHTDKIYFPRATGRDPARLSCSLLRELAERQSADIRLPNGRNFRLVAYPIGNGINPWQIMSIEVEAENGEMVGHVDIKDLSRINKGFDDADAMAIEVDFKYRRQLCGVGEALMNSALALAWLAGNDQFTVSDSEADGFYKNMGFQPSGKSLVRMLDPSRIGSVNISVKK
ncbi:MAG: GNAT family N-acetyltransferase [Candidatus Margulisiibacteriota bacterium]